MWEANVLLIEIICFLLTLILLTWRIWWAPHNASKWQMRFNSAFKGLIEFTSVLWYFVLYKPQWSHIILYTLLFRIMIERRPKVSKHVHTLCSIVKMKCMYSFHLSFLFKTLITLHLSCACRSTVNFLVL